MEKLIAFMLIAALIFCCVGCTQETPEVTDPSSTQPTETDPTETDPTGSDQTDGTEDPTASGEPETVQYTWKQIKSYVDEYSSHIAVYRSREELQNSEYHGMPYYVDAYDEAFFESNTLIIASFQNAPPCGHRVTDLVRNADGSYLLKIEHLWHGVGSDVEFGTSAIIEVNERIPADAEIDFEMTDTIVPPEDRPCDDILDWP